MEPTINNEVEFNLRKNITFDLKIKSEYNYLCYQSDVYYKQKNNTHKITPYSLIEQIVIENSDNTNYNDLKLSFSFSNPILSISDIYISNAIKKKKTKITEGIKVSINTLDLYNINESTPINLKVLLSDKFDVICEKTFDIILTPINESSDIVNIVELLACFVTPNAKEVIDICNIALNYLKEIRKCDTAFIGYQANDLDSVREEMMAIYNALRSLEINYANPPSSFNKFQKVRLPSEVLSNRIGTCLDLAVTYCACIENIGLNPILILKNGHAFAGCFLQDESFVERVCTDSGRIFNLSAPDNLSIELVECTMFTKSHSSSFNDANIASRSSLTLYNDLFYAIDIYSCHKSIFRPIPTKKLNDHNEWIIDADIEKYPEELTRKNTLSNMQVFEGEEVNDKFNFWSKKLLDLSLRNKLINFRLTPNSPQIVYHNGLELLNKILKEESIYLYPNGITLEKDKYFEYDQSNDDLVGLSKRNIYQIVTIDQTLKTLFRTGNSSIEETGSNCLYLSFGLINYVPKNSKKALLAPVFLVPVKGKTKRTNNGYELLIDADNISINTTFFEYLNQTCDISFDELYSVEKNIDNINITTVFNAIRQKTSSDCSIAVDENKCFLSVFSFANYVIWEDIHNRKKQLLENKVIKNLVDGTQYIDENPKSTKFIDNFDPSHLAIPLSADSSQIKAIMDCASGKSFVLDGPPGTGKSQTIVNMIVNSLYNGKSVLFVSEKMAALEVVKKRIDDINLGFFCLELHSNKANKKDVLSQIEKALEHDHTKAPSSFSKSTTELFKQRTYLNQFINKIYEEKYVYSLKESITKYQDVSEYQINLIDEEKRFLNITKDELNNIYELNNTLKAINRKYGEYSSSNFYPFKLSDFDFTKHFEFKNLLTKFNISVQNFLNKIDTLKQIVNIDIGYNRNNIINLLEIVKCLTNEYISTNNLLGTDIYNTNKLNLEVIEKGIINNKLEQEINKLFISDIYETSFSLMLLEYKESLVNNKKIKTFFNSLKLKQFIKKYLINKNQKLNINEIVDNLNKINRYNSNKVFIASNNHFLKKLFTDNYESLSKDFSLMKTYYDNTLILKKYVDLIVDDTDQTTVMVNLTSVLSNIKETLKTNQSLKYKFDLLYQDYLKFIPVEEELANKFEYDYTLFKYNNDAYFSNLYLEFSANMLVDVNQIEGIALYNKMFNKLLENNYPKALLEIYKEGNFDLKDLINYFEAYLSYNLVCEYFKDSYFKEFNGLLFDQSIQKYNDLLEDYTSLIILETASKITKNYPLSNVEYAKSSLISGLKRCIKNSGHRTTIRKILIEFGSLIRTICPCFLMSPMSAAKYLSLDSEKFDVVIFDEASQIPTSEAIGAISRGNSLVVAGDPEQMPPTSFFQVNIGSDDVVELSQNNEDLESLLDDALAIGMPRNRLLWHYRSEHESLIAFSNNMFYEHSLYTFPSPDNSFRKVKLKYLPNGLYEHGKNIIEADAIVKEVERRLKDPILKNQTIGIVTFNIKQQELILEKINNLLESNPKYLEINENNKDKIFVKNLENVQGDERDVIMFSIGFGYNKDKKFHLFLGPLSLEKGERRLNVAVTRARQEMLIFSSIKGNDIKEEKTKNLGATVLKQFLLYAEFGEQALLAENNKQAIINPGIEADIQKELLKRGIKSDIFVGDSKFKINLCIKDDTGKYILGIICDGGTNTLNTTCRDRNSVQIKMLQRLNWNIINVYSIDYMKNKEDVINTIIESINNYKPILDEDNSYQNISFEKNLIIPYTRGREYQKYNTQSTISYNFLSDTKVTKELVTLLSNIIDFEGPITENILFNRYKEILNISKTTVKAKRIFDLNKVHIKKEKRMEFNQIIYYSQNQSPDNIEYYRTSSKDERDILDIPLCEIKNALIDILETQGIILLKDAARILTTFFGNKILTQNTLDKIDKIINYTIDNSNVFEIRDEYLILKH